MFIVLQMELYLWTDILLVIGDMIQESKIFKLGLAFFRKLYLKTTQSREESFGLDAIASREISHAVS